MNKSINVIGPEFERTDGAASPPPAEHHEWIRLFRKSYEELRALGLRDSRYDD